MKVEAIDLFFLQVPDFDPLRDPVKDTLLVRVRAGQYVGWGECEAAPLVSLMAFVTPDSHSTCRSVSASILGQRLEDPSDIARITSLVQQGCANLLQMPHAFSGVEMALWDLLGKKRQEPVYRLFGDAAVFGKQPYVVVPFGTTPIETFTRIHKLRGRGIHAVKVGWGGFGHGDLKSDREQLSAAKEALGQNGRLFIDAAQVWKDDPAAANQYVPMLKEFAIEWLEEPFDPTALDAYATLSRTYGRHQIAAGENIHSVAEAKRLLSKSGIGIIQIDCGRVGGIGAAREIAGFAAHQNLGYVNHTYTSHLSLSASLHAFSNLPQFELCEYPMDETSLSWKICQDHLLLDSAGLVNVFDLPGLGVRMDIEAVRHYTQDLEISLSGKPVYRTPPLEDVS